MVPHAALDPAVDSGSAYSGFASLEPAVLYSLAEALPSAFLAPHGHA